MDKPRPAFVKLLLATVIFVITLPLMLVGPGMLLLATKLNIETGGDGFSGLPIMFFGTIGVVGCVMDFFLLKLMYKMFKQIYRMFKHNSAL